MLCIIRPIFHIKRNENECTATGSELEDHMNRKKIVVIGSGFAGIFATKMLSKELNGQDNVVIKLINDDPYFTFKTRLHEVIGGRIQPKDAQYNLEELFSNSPNVEIIVDQVKAIDDKNKKISASSSNYSYDYAVLAMGGEPNDFGIQGVKEHGFTMWSWEEAVNIRNHITKMVQTSVLEKNPIERQSMLHFVVCGGGLTGVEIMGELIEWKPILEEAYHLEKNEISLTLIEASSSLVPSVTKKESARVKAYFEKKKVNILTESSVSKVTPEEVIIENQSSIQSKTLIWTSGVKATSDVESVKGEFGKAGRLKVHKTMEAKKLKNIYVVGDLAHFEDENDTPIPQNVQTAEYTAKTAAQNIAAKILKNKKGKEFVNKQRGTIISVGATYGVGYLVDKFHIKGLTAVIMKHVVNVIFWIKIRSFSFLKDYIKQEFNVLRHNRFTS